MQAVVLADQTEQFFYTQGAFKNSFFLIRPKIHVYNILPSVNKQFILMYLT